MDLGLLERLIAIGSVQFMADLPMQSGPVPAMHEEVGTDVLHGVHRRRLLPDKVDE